MDVLKMLAGMFAFTEDHGFSEESRKLMEETMEFLKMWIGMFAKGSADPKSNSEMLIKVTERHGFNEESRQIMKETMTIKSLLQSLKASMRGQPSCVKIMGSSIEATSTMEVNSDIDILYFNPVMEVTTNSCISGSKFPYLCMVRDVTTAPGYTKLQLYMEGKVLTYDTIMNDNDFFWHKFLPDTRGRIVLSNENTEYRLKFTNDYERHGPADTLRGGGRPSDHVAAYICQYLPQEVDPWFRRERHYGWPSPVTCGLFKKMGCFVVPVGHPSSPERNLEWRISLTNQELYLMQNLNVVQYRCYILLKLNKPMYNGIISSYHCKTALFYTIENNSLDIWTPENLSVCLLKCLDQLLDWINRKNCPNYFIPEENMFDTKLNDENQRSLQQMIYTQDSLCFCCNMFNFKQSLVHSLLYEGKHMMILGALTINARLIVLMEALLNFIASINGEIIVCLENMLQSLYLGTEVCHSPSFEPFPEKNLYFWFLPDLLPNYRYPFAVPKRQDLSSYLSSNSDIRKTFALIERYISSKLELLYSVNLPRGIQVNYSIDSICANANTIQNKIKLGSVMYMLGHYTDCCFCLKNAETLVRHLSIPVSCICCGYQPDQDLQMKRVLKKYQALVRNNSTLSNSLSVDILADYILMCLKFDTQELNMVPCALLVEAYRSFGIPRTNTPNPDFTIWDISWNNWVVVDPLVYMYYLQYTNYEAMHVRSEMSVALSNLEDILLHDLHIREMGHLETALNVLGHIYSKKGWYKLALECLRKSWKIIPKQNAAKWHMMFMLFGCR